jgi:hypothetical protein
MKNRRLVLVIAVVASSSMAHAAELSPAAIAAWDAYVKTVEARRQREVPESGRFLAADFKSDPASLRHTLRRGVTVIEQIDEGADSAAASGSTIHHWRGLILVRGVSLRHILDALRNPQQHGYKPPDVLKWRLLERRGDWERVFLRIQRQEIVTAVFNTQHDVQFTWHSATSASSRSVATRIAEVEDADAPDAGEKPPGRDRGFLWRMNSYWRYQETADGVLVELESVTLSRSVPTLLKPLAGPIISRVARESVERTLGSIRDLGARS